MAAFLLSHPAYLDSSRFALKDFAMGFLKPCFAPTLVTSHNCNTFL